MTFGRGDSNDIVLHVDGQSTISKNHGLIEFDGERYVLRDTSTNGTLVAGELIRGMARPLESGALVHCGAKPGGGALFELEFSIPQGMTATPRMMRDTIALDAPSETLAERVVAAARAAFAGAMDEDQATRREAVRQGIAEVVGGIDARLATAALERVRFDVSGRPTDTKNPAQDDLADLAAHLFDGDVPKDREQRATFSMLVQNFVDDSVRYLHEALQARMAAVDQLGLDPITRDVGSGNEIKSCRDADELTKLLLHWDRGSHVDLRREQHRSAHQDLHMHAVALVQSWRVAAKAAVEKLSPQQIEDQAGGRSKLFSSAAGRFWDLYKERYAGFSGEDDQFDAVRAAVRDAYRSVLHGAHGITWKDSRRAGDNTGR